MFSWVVKVVPQPPEAPGTLGDEAAKTPAAEVSKAKEVKNQEVKRAEVKSPPTKNTTDEASEESQGQTGVLSWLSNGFVSALPQPGSPRLNRANSTSGSGEEGERSGVMSWVTQGLTKVLPQPDEKYRETNSNNNKTEEVTEDAHVTEVYDVEKMPDYDPLPHIPVVEMVSEDEVSEVESLNNNFPPNVVGWIRQVIPQPVILPPGAVPLEPSAKTPDKIVSPPPESLSGISLDADGKAAGVVGWFVSGLGLRMPQPVISPKDDTAGAAEVLKKASDKLKPDMVLEDVESDNEGKGKQEDQSKALAASIQLNSEPVMSQAPQLEPSESRTKMSQEDAETQTGRWTPFIDSIKKEAEDVALATMEERLLQERFEMARIAEEVARQAAEMAVRQMAAEGGSIKLSLGSQELLEEPDMELKVIQDEESEVDHTKTTEKEESPAEEEREQEEEEEEEEVAPEAAESVPPSEPAETEEPAAKEPDLADPEPEGAAEHQRSSPSPPPNPEPAETPEAVPEAQPETRTEEEAKAEAEPVTQQPAKAEEASKGANAGTAADKAPEAAGEGSGESSGLSLHPAVNVEDVDSDHERGGAGGGGGGADHITTQDPKQQTLTVPVTPSGGRQSKAADKE